MKVRVQKPVFSLTSLDKAAHQDVILGVQDPGKGSLTLSVSSERSILD